ncbi:LOB domain-containing protein 38 isoform X1 [Zea mays]|uniref:LOB domain-containing protein 38 isoform X1 n=1 Tax=Zea mays TaxID=4577 RepID=UPI0004DE7F63|nr:uncharacterized protein LOC100285965 isoform X1 [Zea mays]
MSCNGCRMLRKGCSDACVLRPSLQWIDGGAEAQGHATAFVAKFFGRAGLMSLLTAVPEPQRPVAAVRGGREDDRPGERRRGAARRGELAPVPGGGGDGAAGRRHRPAARVRLRRGPPRRVRCGGEAGRGVLDVLDGEARAGERGGAAGAVVRPRAVAQPRVTPGDRGAAPAAAARHAVHDLRGVRDDDERRRRRRRRREGARAAEPFCLRMADGLAKSQRPIVPCAPRRAVWCA